MLILLGLLLFLTLAFVVLLPSAISLREIFNRYSGSRVVTCPETHQQVAVSIDARHAATTGLNGHPDVRLADCSRWPERWRCDRGCLPEALQTEPYHQGEAEIRSKRIYHLPILLAAFAAWYIGAFWHSHYLFRARWMAGLGLTSSQMKEMVQWYSPHLLSVAVCLLFAYGGAWLLGIRDRRGVGQGVLTSLFLWIALVLATSPALGGISHDLLRLEFGYTLIAAVAVGAIIGGLGDKLVIADWTSIHGATHKTG